MPGLTHLTSYVMPDVPLFNHLHNGGQNWNHLETQVSTESLLKYKDTSLLQQVK